MSETYENTMKVALCASRHPIPDVELSIFPQVVENPLDFDAHDKLVESWIETMYYFLHDENNKLYVYVTGLTPVLVSFLHTYNTRVFPAGASVSLMHYNRETNEYVEQEWY